MFYPTTKGECWLCLCIKRCLALSQNVCFMQQNQEFSIQNEHSPALPGYKGTRMWRRGADSDGYVANFVESEQVPLIYSSPPEVHQGVSSFNSRLKRKLQESEFWAHCLHQSVSMGQQRLVDFMDPLLSPASNVLNRWFESEVLKATLATDAVIGTTIRKYSNTREWICFATSCDERN
ncbi:hypothetical protein L2E82_25566 [Cichorium intybus]|uniref:Uncharacterized protein n=1 Tax=Cichorium intybus TaxID=13427 RepID=A0ACB9E406_CICIN|nr:hypothetical protein L2E82_25566 [Cichorium intybus]